MGESAKAVFLIAIFFIAYFLFGTWLHSQFGLVNGGQDFALHWAKVQGNTGIAYQSFYHGIFSVFSGSQLLFYAANLAIITILIPLLLFLVKKNWWIVAIYFCGVSLPHQLLYGATYPQAIVLLIFCVYLLAKEKHWMWPSILIWLSLASMFFHKEGGILFMGVIVVEAIAFLQENKKYARKAVQPVLSMVWVGLLRPSFIEGPREAIQILIQQIPVPILFFGLKKWDLVNALIALGSFAYSFKDLRALSIAQIVFCLWASQAIKESNLKIRVGFALILVAQLSFFLADFAVGTWAFLALN